LAITFAPLSPWQWVTSVLCVGSVLFLIIRYIFSSRATRQRYFGDRNTFQILILINTLATACFFTLAAWNPILIKITAVPRPQLAVVLDVSQSVLNGMGNFQTLKNDLLRWLEPSISDIDPRLRQEGTGSIIAVGMSGSVVRNSVPLENLSAAINRLSETDLPSSQGTNLEDGLILAKNRIASSGGQGAVLLVTDGNQTDGNAFLAAQTLSKAGIPIYVLPLSGGSSAVYLAAANLPPQISARQETHLRWLVWNQLDHEVESEFSILINSGSKEAGKRSERTVRKNSVVLPGKQWVNFNVPLSFEGVGIQFVDLVMKVKDDQKETQVQRRFFIYVIEPPRVLAIGGDNRWSGYFLPDELIVDNAEAAKLNADTVFQDYDAVVINNVDAHTFLPGFLDRLAQSMTTDGLGLFFVNGQHAPRKDEDPTILNSYEGTPIERLLPVSVKPRDETKEPPSRSVVFLMDVSGSMEGGKLEASKQIARYLIQKYLRPQDRLDVITFTTDAQQVVSSLSMDGNGKQTALQAIDNIPVGGGTDPSRALELLTRLKVTNCGLFFISDGEFAPISARPDCRSAVFDIGQDYVDPNFPLDIADPIPVPDGFNPASIVVPYFEPEIRKKFFESGSFQPLSMKASNPLAATLPFPEDLPLDGSAVSYIKDNADLIAVRPKLTDPVLAFLETDEGTAGVFTSELSTQLLENEKGRSAVREWILNTVAYSARDRYVFQLQDLGIGLELCISIVSESLSPPQVSGLKTELHLGDKEIPFRMSEVDAPGHFCGRILLPERQETLKGTLIIQENGMEAIRKKQKISILIPSDLAFRTALPSEAYSYGTNESLLKELALAGGGLYAPPKGTVIFSPRTEKTRANPLWPWLLILGTLFYLIAIAVRRVNN
jgi:hypothetical protein